MPTVVRSTEPVTIILEVKSPSAPSVAVAPASSYTVPLGATSKLNAASPIRVITGLTVSVTVTVLSLVALLPALSVAVYVRTYVPAVASSTDPVVSTSTTPSTESSAVAPASV